MATTNVNYTLPNSSSPLSIGYYSDSPTDVNGPTRNLIGACAPNFPIKKEDSPQISHFPMQLTQCRSPEDIHLDHEYGMGIRTPPDSPKHKPTTLQIADSPGFSPPSSTMDMLVSPTLSGNPNSTSPILNGSGMNSPSLGPCLICGDKATGNHFGVLSCEACKSFFRRSVRSNARYCCRNSRDCTVEKHTRNRCQYCRFQKCLQMGMKKEAVQEERVSSRYPPNDKRLKITGLINSMSPYCSPYCSPICTPSGTPVGTPLASPYNSPYSTPVSSPKPTRHPIHTDDLVTPAIEALNLNTNTSITVPMLMAADMMSGDSGAGVPIDVSQPASFEEVCESAKTQLLNIIEWAKRIHPFMQLPMDDRMILIKNSWIELLSLRLAFRYVPLEDVLVLGSGKIIQRNQVNDLVIGKITGRILDELVFWFKTLKVDKAEFCCLKTILLFNPDARGLTGETKNRVCQLQQDTLVSLESYIGEHYASQVSRLGKILLRLPALRDITTEVHSYLMEHNSSGISKIDPFLLDMANQNV